MSTLVAPAQVRAIALGIRVQKSTGTLAATTVPLFTIAGGLVLVTSLVGRVTTAITVANSYKLQQNPTIGTTTDLCTAADIGTTDTIVGEILIPNVGVALAKGTGTSQVQRIVLDSGQIESVSAGTDGAILWALTYIPLEDGASVVAA